MKTFLVFTACQINLLSYDLGSLPLLALHILSSEVRYISVPFSFLAPAQYRADGPPFRKQSGGKLENHFLQTE